MSTITCDILLVIGLLTILPFVPIALSMRRLAGPDSAGAAIGYFFLSVPRAICLVIALGVLAARHEFSWIVSEPITAGLIVIIAYCCIEIFIMASSFAASDRSGTFVGWKDLALIPPVAVPLIIILYCFLVLHTEMNPLWLRTILSVIGIAAIAGGAVMGLFLVRQRMVRLEEQNQQAWAAEDERGKWRLEEFDKLGPDAPFGEIIRYGGLTEEKLLHAKIIAAVNARPNWVEELSACLRNEWRGEAIRYVRFAMHPPYPPALAPAVRDALIASAASVRKQAEPIVYTHPDDYDWDCFAAVELADKFANMGVDFREPVKAMLDGIEASPNKEIALRGQMVLKEWLKHHK